MLAGMWTLLAMLDTIQSHGVEELLELARIALHALNHNPP
jgi:hypothetical protein